MAEKQLNRYSKLIEHIFLAGYKQGASEVMFERQDIEQAAQKLGIKLPKNLGDIIYSFDRHHRSLPARSANRQLGAPRGA
jgi:hypothetical protein